MEITDDDIKALSAAIRGLNVPCTALFDRIVQNRQEIRVVSSLVADERLNGAADDYEAVSRAFSKLESFAAASETIACILMVVLWPIAADIFGLHDVPDSIDLWITTNPSELILNYLKSLVLLEKDEAARNHYGSWISELENKTATKK